MPPMTRSRPPQCGAEWTQGDIEVEDVFQARGLSK